MSKPFTHSRFFHNSGLPVSHIAKSFILIMLAFFILGVVQGAAAPTAATKTEAGNVYFRGDDVQITDSILGDLFAVGRRISVRQAVGADGALAGGAVDVKADIGQDLRIAGGNVNIERSIGGDLLAAGGTVKVAKSATTSGEAFIAGGEVIVDGRLDEGAKIYADKLLLSGQITGDTKLYVRQISFSPEAKIDGDLVYASANPLSPDQIAQVSGKVLREKTPDRWQSEANGTTGWFHPIFFLSMVLCGSLLFLLFPNSVNGARQTIKRYPLRSLLIGLALLFTVPPVAIMFMLTVVGIPIGLALLALYPLFFLLGYLATAFFLGRETANALHQPSEIAFGRQIFFLAAALLILAIAAMIPVLGGLIMFVALVVGTGGWAVWLYQRFSRNAPPSAAAGT